MTAGKTNPEPLERSAGTHPCATVETARTKIVASTSPPMR